MRANNCEELERRTFLSDPATIIWTNRATTGGGGVIDSDNFSAVFGALAPTARAVVDAVIARFDQMIGSFNYPTGGTTYGLSLHAGAFDGTFSGTGVVDTTVSGKPLTGSVTISGGSLNGSADHGWFIDATPNDNSEFLGTLVNAFAGDAQSGSAALGKPDFYSAIEYQMLKALGATSSVSGWSSHTTDTGVADSTSGVGNLWVFSGPSVKHLMSSNSDGVDAHAANHSAPLGDSISFGGDNYVGAADIGNGNAPLGRRYLLDTPFALMLKDAYGYSAVDPASIDSFYSVLTNSTHQLQVRGGDFGTNRSSQSADNVDLDVLGNGNFQIGIDIGSDVAGTGAFAGAGNLGAFVSTFIPASVTSMSIQTSRGIDSVNVHALGSGVVCSINLGSENDSATIGGGDYDSKILGPIIMMGGMGFDAVTVDDSADDLGNDAYTLGNISFSKTDSATTTWTGVENITVNGSPQSDQIAIQSLSGSIGLNWNAGAGSDTFTLGNNNSAAGIVGQMTLAGGAGSDSIILSDSAVTTGVLYNIFNTSLQRLSTNSTINFDSTVESLSLTGSDGDNTIVMATGAGSPSITVNGAGGADTIYVTTDGYNLAGNQQPITIDGGSDASSDTINLLLGATPSGTYNLRTNSLNGTDLPTINYTNFENCNLTGGANSDIFAVFSTLASVATSINGSGGSDVIYLGGIGFGSFTLDNIAGPISVDGSTGSDILGFNDTNETSAETYTISSTTIDRTGMARITYTSCETIGFIGGLNADEFDVNSTTASEPIVITSNNGADSLFVNDNAAGSFVTFDGGAGLDTIDVNSDSAGSASVHLANSQDLASLNIRNGGTLVVDKNGSSLLATNSLSIPAGGKLDLNDNDMLIDYTNQTPYSTVSNWIKTMRNGGTWNGATGITSSSASSATSHNTTLGVLEGRDWMTMYPAANFDAHTVDNTMVLVKYTYYGDANFNGKVDGGDYSRIDFAFTQQGAGSIGGWINGDFNGDGKIDGSDYSLMDFAFTTQGATVLRPGANSGGLPSAGKIARR